MLLPGATFLFGVRALFPVEILSMALLRANASTIKTSLGKFCTPPSGTARTFLQRGQQNCWLNTGWVDWSSPTNCWRHRVQNVWPQGRSRGRRKSSKQIEQSVERASKASPKLLCISLEVASTLSVKFQPTLMMWQKTHAVSNYGMDWMISYEWNHAV